MIHPRLVTSDTYYEDWSSAHASGVCRGASKDGRGCPYCWWTRYGLPEEERRYASSTAVRRPYSPRLTAALAAVSDALDEWLAVRDRGADDGPALAALTLADDERQAALADVAS